MPAHRDARISPPLRILRRSALFSLYMMWCVTLGDLFDMTPRREIGSDVVFEMLINKDVPIIVRYSYSGARYT